MIFTSISYKKINSYKELPNVFASLSIMRECIDNCEGGIMQHSACSEGCSNHTADCRTHLITGLPITKFNGNIRVLRAGKWEFNEYIF